MFLDGDTIQFFNETILRLSFNFCLCLTANLIDLLQSDRMHDLRLRFCFKFEYIATDDVLGLEALWLHEGLSHSLPQN